MIPHIIHYCWFGGTEIPKRIKKYIEGWKELLPDYDFIEWNEKNFPIDFCQYSKDAYEAKKYAFVSDVARLYGIYNYGGIYLDTDIEILKRFDEYLNEAKIILSMESSILLMTGFIASEKGSNIFGELLNEYQNRNFKNSDGSLNCIANTVYLTDYIKSLGISLDSEHQKIEDGICIYDYRIFGAFNADTSTFDISDDTVLVHHCMASWGSLKFRFILFLKVWLAKNTGGLYEKIRQYKNSRRRGC